MRVRVRVSGLERKTQTSSQLKNCNVWFDLLFLMKILICLLPMSEASEEIKLSEMSASSDSPISKEKLTRTEKERKVCHQWRNPSGIKRPNRPPKQIKANRIRERKRSRLFIFSFGRFLPITNMSYITSQKSSRIESSQNSLSGEKTASGLNSAPTSFLFTVSGVLNEYQFRFRPLEFISPFWNLHGKQTIFPRENLIKAGLFLQIRQARC